MLLRMRNIQMLSVNGARKDVKAACRAFHFSRCNGAVYLDNQSHRFGMERNFTHDLYCRISVYWRTGSTEYDRALYSISCIYIPNQLASLVRF